MKRNPTKIKVYYYASLREQRGLDQEIIQTNAASVQNVYDELRKKYYFHLSTKQLRVAVNDNYVQWDHKIEENDNLIFIPPVSGG